MRDWLQAKIAPMLAATSDPFDSDDFLFEIKWDGIRALAFFGRGVARLQGRKLVDSSDRYPEIVAALRKLPGEGILDGEVVVLGDEGRPDFQRVLIREQTHSLEAAVLKARLHPVAYIAFDLLYLDGKPLFETALLDRRRLLSHLLAHSPSPIVESTYVVGRGEAFFREAAARRLEGVVAKRLESRYLPGERSRDWLKLKVRRTIEAVVVGLVRERGTSRVKSLVLGGHRDGELIWVGNVGSGLDEATLRELSTELDSLHAKRPSGFTAEAPGDIEWLEPRLVARVEYAELTREGRLRHPVFIGFVNQSPEACLAPSR